ncbi:MAG: GNAT family N-acetyltransferase [Bacteroidales bacterium]
MGILEAQNINLRAVEPTDAELIYEWENDTSIWYAGNTIEPFSRHVIEQYAKNAQYDLIQSKQLRLMIDLKSESPGEQKTIGSIDLFDINMIHQRAGVGILIHKKNHRQKGYAYEALQTIIKYAKDVLFLHQLYCNIDFDNSPSIKLFEKAGFKQTGIKKEWIRTEQGWKDEYFYQIILKS